MVCTVGVGTAAEYYLDEQAAYYTDGEEPLGKWYTPAGAFGLQNGEAVDAATFRYLHAGADPSGTMLIKENKGITSDRVGGYDLTFSAPKSVSVLWAVSDKDTRKTIERSQEKSVRATLDILRANAGYARRGKGGVILEKVDFLAATFQHGESRPTEREDGTVSSDPQLHTHTVIFNLAQRSDGTWGALDGRHFFKWKMAAGAIYRAELARELQKELSVEIEQTEDGLFEIAGVSKLVRDHFSSRRCEIVEELKSFGLETREAQALASSVTKTSRRSKASQNGDAEDRHQRWRAEASSLGFDGRGISACLQGEDARLEPSDNGFEDVPRKLTETEAIFRLENVYRDVAEQALGAGHSVDDIQQTVEAMIQKGVIVEVGSDDLGVSVYSTKEMIQTENDLVAFARKGANRKRHALSAQTIHKWTASSDLSEEQAEAVRFVTTGSDITVLEGAAGAGKTYALRSVADVYREQGYRVIGTSTAWRMAHQLADDLNIEAKATDAWLAEDRAGKPFLDGNTVLIVDEAGQLSSRQMLNILRAAEASEAKVILTGDQRQLQAIGAGPGLRLVAEQTGVVRIDTIVRQRQEWARRAVTDFSVGRTDDALAAFEEHDALTWCADEKETVRQAVDDWKASKDQNPDKVALVMAKTNKQVSALNVEMRNHLRETGHIRGEEHTVRSANSKEINVAVGDQIMFKKRFDALGVINGTIGTVKRATGNSSDVRLEVDVQGRTIRFPVKELADETGRVPIDHAYASTIYSAQGATVDDAFVIADHTLKRNEIYVAASRARDRTHLYLNRDGVEKAVRSNMPLTDTSRTEIPFERLRQALLEDWSRTQTKSSTRHYSFASSRSKQIVPELQNQHLRPSSKGFRLPQMEVGY